MISDAQAALLGIWLAALLLPVVLWILYRPSWRTRVRGWLRPEGGVVDETYRIANGLWWPREDPMSMTMTRTETVTRPDFFAHFRVGMQDPRCCEPNGGVTLAVRRRPRRFRTRGDTGRISSRPEAGQHRYVWEIGFAVCSLGDHYNKAKGRELAEERLNEGDVYTLRADPNNFTLLAAARDIFEAFHGGDAASRLDKQSYFERTGAQQ